MHSNTGLTNGMIFRVWLSVRPINGRWRSVFLPWHCLLIIVQKLHISPKKNHHSRNKQRQTEGNVFVFVYVERKWNQMTHMASLCWSLLNTTCSLRACPSPRPAAVCLSSAISRSAVSPLPDWCDHLPKSFISLLYLTALHLLPSTFTYISLNTS